MNVKFIFLIMLLFLTASGGMAGKPSGEEAAGYGDVLLQRINLYRQEHGLQPLRSDPDLYRLAREHSLEMLHRKMVDHHNFDARFEQAGGRLCVENLGWNFRSPEKMFDGWRRSTEHNQNMLDAGVTRAGVAEAGRYVTFFACR